MELLEFFPLAARWLFDKKARLELSGYRPEVICLVRESSQPHRYLLIRPTADPSVWIPPQEGIASDESIENAALRCLRFELGLEEAQVQFRKSIWLGKRTLAQARRDERDLRFSLRGLVTKHRMVGKGYFGALVVVAASAEIAANEAEVNSWAWVSSDEYHKRIATNAPDKLLLLQKLAREFIGSVVASAPGEHVAS